jgi:hypothetical protein
MTAAVLVTSAGCASTRLHNAEADAQAKKASDAIVAANLRGALEAERTAMNALAKREQEAVKRDQLGLRDRKLTAILAATTPAFGWDFLQEEVNGRLKLLAGSVDAAKSLENAVLRRDAAAAQLVPQRQNYLLLTKGRTALTCPVGPGQRPEAGSDLEIAIRPFETACASLQKASADLAAASGQGLLASLNTNVTELKTAQAEYEARLAAAKSAYQAALQQSKAGTQGSDKPSLLATLKSRYDDMGNVSLPKRLLEDKVLAKLSDSARLEQITAQRKALEDWIQAFEGESTGASPTSAQERLVALRKLADALNQPTPAPLTALILQAEHLRLEAAGIERHVQRAKERLELLGAKQASMVEEVLFLNAANKALADFSSAGRCRRQQAVYDTFVASAPNCRLLLAQALTAYVNAVTFGMAEQEQIDFQLIAQGHQAALDESETALAQTDNLIRVPVAQLAKAYAGGLKPEELANLVNALGLGAIAARVR